MQESTQTFTAVQAADSLVGDRMPAYIPLNWEELPHRGYSNSYAIMLEREQFEVWNANIIAEFGDKAGYHFEGDLLVPNSPQVETSFGDDWWGEERVLLQQWGIPDANPHEPVTIVLESDRSQRVVYFIHGGWVVYV